MLENVLGYKQKQKIDLLIEESVASGDKKKAWKADTACTEIVWTTSIRNEVGVLEFTLIDPTRVYKPKIDSLRTGNNPTENVVISTNENKYMYNLGNKVIFKVNDKILFSGTIWSLKTGKTKEVKITAYDNLIKLKSTYKGYRPPATNAKTFIDKIIEEQLEEKIDWGEINPQGTITPFKSYEKPATLLQVISDTLEEQLLGLFVDNGNDKPRHEWFYLKTNPETGMIVINNMNDYQDAQADQGKAKLLSDKISVVDYTVSQEIDSDYCNVITAYTSKNMTEENKTAENPELVVFGTESDDKAIAQLGGIRIVKNWIPTNTFNDLKDAMKKILLAYTSFHYAVSLTSLGDLDFVAGSNCWIELTTPVTYDMRGRQWITKAVHTFKNNSHMMQIDLVPPRNVILSKSK